MVNVDKQYLLVNYVEGQVVKKLDFLKNKQLVFAESSRFVWGMNEVVLFLEN